MALSSRRADFDSVSNATQTSTRDTRDGCDLYGQCCKARAAAFGRLRSVLFFWSASCKHQYSNVRGASAFIPRTGRSTIYSVNSEGAHHPAQSMSPVSRCPESRPRANSVSRPIPARTRPGARVISRSHDLAFGSGVVFSRRAGQLITTDCARPKPPTALWCVGRRATASLTRPLARSFQIGSLKLDRRRRIDAGARAFSHARSTQWQSQRLGDDTVAIKRTESTGVLAWQTRLL